MYNKKKTENKNYLEEPSFSNKTSILLIKKKKRGGGLRFSVHVYLMEKAILTFLDVENLEVLKSLTRSGIFLWSASWGKFLL